MNMNPFIAIAAGCASALMFASIISGALISLLLFYLAPLPLMVAAMGWGPACAALGGAFAGASLGVLFGPSYSAAFVLTVALPAWWLGHLVLLGRPATSDTSPQGVDAAPGDPPPVDWYPLGRILIWIACFAALTTTAALLTLGSDASTIADTLRRGLLRITNVRDTASGDRASEVVDVFVAIAPAAAATIAMATLTLNVWLAAKVTATSGRLRRPWPDVRTMTLPPMALVATMVALALCFIGGLPAILAQIVTACLMMTYALVGFAVLHTITLTMRNRGLWLGSVYAIVLMFVWPVITIVGIGIADAIFGFRQRYMQRHTPPPIVPKS
ncbi:DUF2232 domain-containing protein [Nitrobacter sp.]|uniref:DUF2232 domain-containing protein n=1 Tax=Nitrobacter sp. TaxID=29420 RepID=UPI001D1CAD42|nr:DUF2232 domain-containing protein [Nitrobacter sp.]MCB1392681.1 DUF2232 domain-containing protein [Nitrobacter sp.]MCV0385341.1 DUF2232 domain-containing protein [Nitrobacter sp.]